VNRELEQLESALPQAVRLLAPAAVSASSASTRWRIASSSGSFRREEQGDRCTRACRTSRRTPAATEADRRAVTAGETEVAANRAPAARCCAWPRGSPHEHGQLAARGRGALGAVLGSALGVVYAKHEARSRFNELQKLTTQRDDLDIEWASCKLEQSTWATHGRVERVAREELRMVIPQASDLRIVQP